MTSLYRALVLALLCALATACGGGGGGGDSGSGNPGSGNGGVGNGGSTTPTAPKPNTYLPTDTSILLNYSGQIAPARFEATENRNSVLVAPFLYPTGGKEYYVSTADAVSFAGFYSPQVVVAGVGSYTADARFATAVPLFSSDSNAPQTRPVSGTGTVTITPTYGNQSLSYTGTVTYVGTEAITNALGTFNSKHVRLSLTLTTTVQGTAINLPYDVDLWFSRDLGIVQRGEAGQTLRLVAASGPDGDGDGVFNGLDAFPANAAEARDFDVDGVGDNADADDDNDATPDVADRFPFNAAESVDTDNDGVGDKVDSDDDNDQIADTLDAFPLNSGESTDADHDGTGDNSDPDDDNDNVADAQDDFPNDPTRHEQLNIDRSTMTLNAVFGSAAMPSNHFNVMTDTAGWQAQSSASWLQLSAQSGAGDALVMVSTDTQGLAPGTHTAKITVTDAASPRSLEIAVQITVTLPQLSVTTTALSYDGQFGWNQLTRPIDVSLNTGLKTWPVSIVRSFDVPGAITTSYADGVASHDLRRLNVTLDPSKLGRGRKTGTLTITANVDGYPISRTVSLESIASERVLYPSNDAVTMAQIGIFPLQNRSVTIEDSYGLTGTPWTATSSDPARFQVTPSGVSGDTLTVTADPAGLAEGLYLATITVATSDDNIDRVVPIRVSLWVQPTHAGYHSQAAIYSQLASDPLRPYVYAHNASGDIDVFNVHNQQQLPSIAAVGTDLGPMTTSSDGKWLFVLRRTDGSVTRIDLDNTASRTTWPLTDFKPTFQPTAIVYARPNGHGVLMLNDMRVVDAATGTVFPVGRLTSIDDFDVAKATPKGNRVCAVTTQANPFSGSCFVLHYGNYGTPDVRTGIPATFDGFGVPGAGFARDLAITADGSQAIIAVQSNLRPLVRASVMGGYSGPVFSVGPTDPLRTGLSAATSPDGSVYGNIMWDSDGSERILGLTDNHSQKVNFSFGDLTTRGMPGQMVVTGDSMGLVYLAAPTASSQTVSSKLNFVPTY